MASHIVGYPRIGEHRELTSALHSFWNGLITLKELHGIGAKIRSSIWKQMKEAGIVLIPSNIFSFYDNILDTSAMLGVEGVNGVPLLVCTQKRNISLPARMVTALTIPGRKMKKWFDTTYHYVVPELGPDTKFCYKSRKAVEEYKEARRLGVGTIPVLVGPVTYLLLSRPTKGVEKSFSLLSLIGKILPIYREILAELKAAGTTWIQFDEPTLVLDLNSEQLDSFARAYSELEASFSGLNVLIQTYFADVPAPAYRILTSFKGVMGFGFDLVHGQKTIDLIKEGFPSGKYLFAGVVDGRNIWANDLAASLTTLQTLEGFIGKGKVVVSTSCSLLHTAVDSVYETKMDEEMLSWFAFAAQKVVEVNALARALSGHKDEEFFFYNAAVLASRKSSPRVTNLVVQMAAAGLRGSDHCRATNVKARLDAQRKKLNLPVLPTTTIGISLESVGPKSVCREYRAKKMSKINYNKVMKEIERVVRLQEELGLDILVHGEPERDDVVEYFAEQLSGFAVTLNGWVQCYGTCCIKPPIIYGDVRRPRAMSVFWSSMAQRMTKRPMKGMLLGPASILNWSFVRDDKPRYKTCYQIALAIKDEVEDLQKAGISIIQIDEAALQEGLPLRKCEQKAYLKWASLSFRITNCGVRDTTQIHVHLCFSELDDCSMLAIKNMDADVVTVQRSTLDEELLMFSSEVVKYGSGIGPALYDIHSASHISPEDIADRINKMLSVLDSNLLWINPDCFLKLTSNKKSVLGNMVAAAKLIRAQLASAS